MHEHIANVFISSNQALHARNIKIAHGVGQLKIFRPTLIYRLLYTSSAWWHFATQT